MYMLSPPVGDLQLAERVEDAVPALDAAPVGEERRHAVQQGVLQVRQFRRLRQDARRTICTILPPIRLEDIPGEVEAHGRWSFLPDLQIGKIVIFRVLQYLNDNSM